MDKNREDQARQWQARLQEWKEKRYQKNLEAHRSEDVDMQRVAAELAQANKRAGDLEARLKEKTAKLEQIEKEAQVKETQFNFLKAELARQEAASGQVSEQVSKIKNESVLRLTDMEKRMAAAMAERAQLAEEAGEKVMKLEKMLQDKELALHSSTDNHNQALAQMQSLMSQLEAKNRDLEETARALSRYQGGDAVRNLQTRIHELEKASGELQTTLQGKEKELKDFRDFLASREKEMSGSLERASHEHGAAVESLNDIVKQQKERIQDLETELVSFRNLLKREEERSRRQDAVVRSLEEDRRKLTARLSSLGSEIQEYQSKISRHFDPLTSTAALPKREPPVSINPAADAVHQVLADLSITDYGGDDILSIDDAQDILDAEVESVKEDLGLDDDDEGL